MEKTTALLIFCDLILEDLMNLKYFQDVCIEQRTRYFVRTVHCANTGLHPLRVHLECWREFEGDSVFIFWKELRYVLEILLRAKIHSTNYCNTYKLLISDLITVVVDVASFEGNPVMYVWRAIHIETTSDVVDSKGPPFHNNNCNNLYFIKFEQNPEQKT